MEQSLSKKLDRKEVETEKIDGHRTSQGKGKGRSRCFERSVDNKGKCKDGRTRQ
jgi:hypothetical protein